MCTRSTVAAGVISVCTLLCVLHLLAMQLSAAAPLRGASQADWPARIAAGQMEQIDQLMRRAADGHNLQLCFDPHSMANPATQNMLTLMYFRSVYTLCPARVFVGRNERVINNGLQLANAGDVPDAAWLAAHDVKNVLSLGVDGEGQLVMNLLSRDAQRSAVGTPRATTRSAARRG